MNDAIFFAIWWFMGFVPVIVWYKLYCMTQRKRVTVEDFAISFIAGVLLGPIIGIVSIAGILVTHCGPYLYEKWQSIANKEIW